MSNNFVLSRKMLQWTGSHNKTVCYIDKEKSFILTMCCSTVRAHLCLSLYNFVDFFASQWETLMVCQFRGSWMWVFTTIKDKSVPLSSRELRLGFLFLFMRENILSSPAFECGTVITAATWKRGSNSSEFVPGFFTPFRYPQRISTR